MGCFLISSSIISICFSFSSNVSMHWITQSEMPVELTPIDFLATSFNSSILDKEYLPLEASLAKFLSLSILVLAIASALGYSFKMALIACVFTSTIDSSSGKTRSRYALSLIFILEDSVIKKFL